MDEPLPGVNDPGGAHGKGYTAEPQAERTVQQEDPVPLVSDQEVQDHAQKPDQSQAVQSPPAGGPATNSRVMGAGR
jgi:hypothetical protein